MTEDIADEIRVWIKDYYEKTGKLPELPSEESGGSRHIFSRQGRNCQSIFVLLYYHQLNLMF